MGEPQGFDRKEILHRIGTFFLLVGIGLLVFFLLSEAAKNVTFSYFCWRSDPDDRWLYFSRPIQKKCRTQWKI